MSRRPYESLPATPAVAIALLGAMMCTGQSSGAQPASAGPQKPGIQDAWDALIQNAIPQAIPDPALTLPQTNVQKGVAGDFLNHFFLETRTEYWRTDTGF